MAMAAVASRRGGRDARRTLRTSRRESMLPALRHGLPYTEPLDPEQIERIHLASMDILEEVGVEFRDPVALEDWRQAGPRKRSSSLRAPAASSTRRCTRPAEPPHEPSRRTTRS